MTEMSGVEFVEARDQALRFQLMQTTVMLLTDLTLNVFVNSLFHTFLEQQVPDFRQRSTKAAATVNFVS